MQTLADIENVARLARITCGWKKPELPLDWVRRYWRDAHSPAISRRKGIYDYRHFQYDDVDPGLLPNIEGVQYDCPDHQQLMWNSDVRYRDDAGLAAFDASPPSHVKPHILGDIDIIVDQSTTYRAVGDNAHTYVDSTGDATPQGTPTMPSYCLFLRQRDDEDQFRSCVRTLSEHWSQVDGVRRLRLSLFDVPDMEAERKAGYPVKTHPLELQYQGVIEISLEHRDIAAALSNASGDIGTHISALHAYPIYACYTNVYGGRPTLVGLRGFPAYQAIDALDAENQTQVELLEWMYGEIAKDGPVETQS